MRRGALLFGVVVAVFVAVGLSAQSRNFAGKWTLDTAQSGSGREGGRGPASDFEIKMDAKTFVVSTWRGEVETVMTYKLDGSPSYNKPAGRNPVERAYQFAWDGDKAVISSKTAEGEEKTQYWLQGDSLVREVTRPGAQPSTVRTYFKRAK